MSDIPESPAILFNPFWWPAHERPHETCAFAQLQISHGP